MLPIYRIELIFQRQRLDTSTEISDLITALDILKTWSLLHQDEFNPHFYDRKRQEAITKSLEKLVQDFGFWARIKRFLKNEVKSVEEEYNRAMLISKVNGPIKLSSSNSNKDFCTEAINILNRDVIENLSTQGKPSKNWLSICLKTNLADYDMSLNLYRFIDDTLEVTVSIDSMSAYDDNELKLQGKAYMDKLAKHSGYIFN